MNKHEIVFYPVANGDTSQVITSNGRRILFDFCHRSCGEDPDDPVIDLNSTLKEELSAVERDNFDVVAFTHADKDHISGSTNFFELQHAEKYQGNGRIKIKTLWIPAAMLLENASNDEQSEEFVILRQEARYRLLEGKDILVFSHPAKLDEEWLYEKLKERGLPLNARDHLFVDAGTIVPGFNLIDDKVEFFCHSPFIKHCDDGDFIRNEASLVFNVRLDADGEYFDYLEVGDTDSEGLEDIVSITEYHGNMDRLAWDVFNIPHHCSYKSLNKDEKGDKETTPKPLVEKILLAGKADAYIVSSSCPVTDIKESYEQVQPPHIQARKTYEKYINKVGGRKFLVTMEEPNANKPKPIRFEIASSGISLIKAVATGASFLASVKPPRAG